MTPTSQEFSAGRVLPSARGAAFFYADFLAAGEFPRELDHTEDVVFFQMLTSLTGPPYAIDEPALTWDARSSLSAYSRQYRNYARGDAMAGIYLGRNLARPAFHGAAAVLAHRGRPTIYVAAAGWLLVLRRPLMRLRTHPATAEWRGGRRLAAAFIIQIVGDASKGLGYLLGHVERQRSRRCRRVPSFRETRSPTMNEARDIKRK